MQRESPAVVEANRAIRQLARDIDGSTAELAQAMHSLRSLVAIRIDEHVDGRVELTIFDQPTGEEMAEPFDLSTTLNRVYGSVSHSITIPADQRSAIAAALLGYSGKVRIQERQVAS